MARRKNTRRFDPRYFMDEKTDTIKEAINLDAPMGQSVYEPEPEPEKYPDQSEPYDPFYNDDVEADKAKLAADMKNALKYFSADQIVTSLERGLEYMGRPGKEAFIEISKIFDELGKPHHGKHQDI
jgi:hypothetical protein